MAVLPDPVAATALKTGAGDDAGHSSDLRWMGLAIAAGLLAMYIPVVFFDKLGTVWQTEENSHGPIVLAILLWLFLVHKRDALLAGLKQPRPRPWIGAGLIAIALYIYAIGRGFDALIFQLGALIPLLAGVLLVISGWPTVRALWFPLAFIVFLIPIPSSIVIELTGALKGWVSTAAEQILYWFGFPIGRSGVILQIGPYQLMVADACSGLNSMFSLSALGALYTYFTHSGSPLRTAIVLTSVLPIAFAANVVRVITLVLITYYWGDEAAQGFLHSAAGLLLFVVALLLLFTVDRMCALIARRQRPTNMNQYETSSPA